MRECTCTCCHCKKPKEKRKSLAQKLYRGYFDVSYPYWDGVAKAALEHFIKIVEEWHNDKTAMGWESLVQAMRDSIKGEE